MGIVVKGEEKLRQLESLSKAAHDFMGCLGEMSLGQCLHLIASNAAQMLDAETCDIYLVKGPGVLSLEASHARSPQNFIKGTELPVTADSDACLISRIAYSGKIFNACGESLAAHLTEEDGGHRPAEPDQTHSLLIIPLKKRVGSEEKLSGLLCARNKKGEDGRAHASLGFTVEDEWVLNILAENIVVAIGNVELVERLNEQKDHLGRLVRSSPNGIIAIDAHGSITEFNKRSEEILGYKAEEVMNTSITSLYLNPKEGRRLAKRLLPTGRLEGYETRLRAKSGEEVPLRVSATLLSDPRGNRAGAVGYFEDLRSLRQAGRRLELLLKASNTVAHSESLQDGLRSLSEMITKNLGHTFCRILLIDESKKFMVVRAAHPLPSDDRTFQWNPGFGQHLYLADWPDLLSALDEGRYRVLSLNNKNVRHILEELTEQLSLGEELQSLLLIPMKIGSKIVGMLELGEISCDERRQFTTEKIGLASAITEQAAVLIDRLKLHEITRAHEEDMARLDEAAQAISAAFKLEEVLLKIVEKAKEILGADSSTIWPYDKEQDRFATQELVAVGIPPDIQEEFRGLEPHPGGTTHTVMHNRYVEVPDINQPEIEYIRSRRFNLLKRMGVESFQGIVLDVGEEVVGVLYVNYNRPIVFGDENRRTLKNLATHAALSLKRARLLDQVTKAKKAAEVVARVTVLGKVDETLSEVTNGTLDAIGCDAVTLYVYNPNTTRCEHPPKMAGVIHQNRLIQHEVLPGSLIYQILQMDGPYLVENVAATAIFGNTRFARDEGIESCVAVPLKVSHEPLGVMFVNYRKPHHFTADEISNISLFANQAAVAVRNAQLFNESKRRLNDLSVLAELSEEFLRTVSPKDILDLAVNRAMNVLQTDCCNIVLPDKDDKLLFEALAGSWTGVVVGVTEMGRGKDSQTGYTIQSQEAVFVSDYWEENRFHTPQIVLDNNLISGMSVPMKEQNVVVGAMLVHTKKKRFFTDTEANLLSLIANQTAIAHKSARQFESLERKSASLDALHQAAKSILSSFSRERSEVLNQIVEHAVRCIRNLKGEKATFGTIQFYNEQNGHLTFKSAHPPKTMDRLIDKIEPRDLRKSDPIGISGTAVITKKPQLVDDVREREDYVEFDSATCSELAVPLLDTEQNCYGVLNVESDKPGAFDEEDLVTLQALAELAVIAIQNSKQKGLVNARTALAWMGISGSQWRHAIHAHAITIKNNVEEARADLKSGSFDTLKERLSEINELAQLITGQPIAPPLSGLESVSVNELLRERVEQLWEHRSHRQAVPKFKFDLDDHETVRSSAGWLNRALDVLIDNSVEAMKDSKLKVLTIQTSRSEGHALIEITDTGIGMSEDIWLDLLENPIEKARESKGLGVGLLIARIIIQVYGGDILKGSTGPNGTAMIIKLPLE
ncbi:MAG TPA: GAF domain-containing protein [Pyrinomonadaceae bacterium]